MRSAAKLVASVLKEGDLVILESTVPPHTTQMMSEVLAEESGLPMGSFYTAHCPERVLPGRILYELEHNDRIIGSSDPRAAQMTKELYETFVKEGHCLTCDDVTAEMCKLVENTYRDINIAFANQLSEICAVAGIDVHELIALANRHPRVNILSPGLGVGYAVYGCEPNSTADTLEGIPLLSLDECLDVCDHVVIALGHREFLSPQARAKILSVPHYDCIGFEQGEKR